jgi:hypothetical protein
MAGASLIERSGIAAWLFDAGDYNLFRYCHNDPIDNVDPMGLEQNYAGLAPREVSRMRADQEEGQKQMANEAYNRGMANAQRTMHDAHGGAMGIGEAGYNTWLRDKDGKLSSGEHFRSEAKAASKLIERSFTAQELSGDAPKERYE